MKIKQLAKLFKARKVTVKMKREYINNPMIIHLPDGVGNVEDDLGISKIKIDYEVIKETICFTVCVDDFLFIDKDYKFTDDESKKAFFGQVAKKKDGTQQSYSSIDARAVAVITAIIEGKIRLNV